MKSICLIVLVKITYGLPVYGASEADLNIIQCFLKRCFKGLCELLDIRQLLEEKDRKKKKKNKDRQLPLSKLHGVKESSTRLRSNCSLLPKVNTERFKNSFINRLNFKYKQVI